MNTSKGNSGSHPDISKYGITDIDNKNISMRKRKTPEDELSQQLEEFKKEILEILKSTGKEQIESIKTIRHDISSIKEQLGEIKTTTDQLISENKHFKTQIDDLVTTVTSTKEKLKSLEDDFNALQTNQISSLNLTNQNAIISEVQERIERSRNIIIVGITEPHMEDMEKKRDFDRSEVLKNLRAIHPQCPEPEKIIRLGKYEGKETRPIKICFSSQNTAKAILKKKSNVNGNIKIFSDQTPTQQQTIIKLREELKQRIESGEKELTIKYVKGIPKITKDEPKN